MKDIAIIGTVGVPANYGGFETLVDNLVVAQKDADIHYTVYCCAKNYEKRPASYHRAKLEYISRWSANGSQSIIYDMVSMWRARRSDVLLILGVSGCLFLPVLRLFSRSRLVVNIDGLEHRRAKWNWGVRKFLKLSERIAVWCADQLITDNKGIADYVSEEYGKSSEVIAYGGDHVLREHSDNIEGVLAKYGLNKREYALSLCRIEPENNCHLILEAIMQKGDAFVFIGNWKNSEYGRSLKKKYGAYKHITLLDAIYDLDELFALRNSCHTYIHGHSAGGTNPSLVEAMFMGCHIVAFDCIYNRASTEDKAVYFKDVKTLVDRLELSCNNGGEMLKMAEREYTWKKIVERYEMIYSEK